MIYIGEKQKKRRRFINREQEELLRILVRPYWSLTCFYSLLHRLASVVFKDLRLHLNCSYISYTYIQIHFYFILTIDSVGHVLFEKKIEIK